MSDQEDKMRNTDLFRLALIETLIVFTMRHGREIKLEPSNPPHSQPNSPAPHLGPQVTINFIKSPVQMQKIGPLNESIGRKRHISPRDRQQQAGRKTLITPKCRTLELWEQSTGAPVAPNFT